MCEYKYIKDQLNKIYDYYGQQRQYLKLVEEMGELTVAIFNDDYDNLMEELADVSIVLEQIILNLDKKDKEQFENIRFKKIVRTLKRIESAKNKNNRKYL